jgi:hypothetical protein
MKRAIAIVAFALFATAAFAADPLVPDPRLTPGNWHVPPTPLATLCKPGFTATVRNVTEATKQRVLRSYGIAPAKRAGYEIDHLVSLELDGTNTVANLWPESYSGSLGARRKDVLEGALKRLVCSGKLSLATAQAAIAHDWPAAYRRYVGTVGK